MLRGGAIGVLCAALALGVAELVAAFVGQTASPIISVGAAAIDATPEPLKAFAIRTFGEADKAVLMGGIVVTLILLAALIGAGAVRRPWIGYAGLAILGGLGAAAATTRPNGRWMDMLPSAMGALAGAASFRLLGATADRLPASDEAVRASNEMSVVEAPAVLVRTDRRGFLRAGLMVGGAAIVAGAAGRAISSKRFDVTASREQIRVPAPSSRARPVPDGAELDLEGLSPFVTPNDRFYRVDTALLPPRLTAEDWRLRIHGMVERELDLDYQELLRRPMIERDITLTCVSNEVGGPYAGNARWIGVPLRDILDEAGIDPRSDQILSTAVDGFTIGTPTGIATDGRDAMLAVAMNGEPLPVEHGFPVRMVIPGLYGYTSATKWVVDIELTTFDTLDAYWVQRGWAREGRIETMARIDTPRPLASVTAGRLAVAGVAWAQHRGIATVEIRVDGGTWQPARLADVPTIDTWRQWVWEWDAAPGRHTLEARATDGEGRLQTEERSEPFPDGATGWHSVVMTVT